MSKEQKEKEKIDVLPSLKLFHKMPDDRRKDELPDICICLTPSTYLIQLEIK